MLVHLEAETPPNFDGYPIARGDGDGD